MAHLALLPHRRRPGWWLVRDIREKWTDYESLPSNARVIFAGSQELAVRPEKSIWSNDEVFTRQDVGPFIRQNIEARKSAIPFEETIIASD